MLPRLIAVLFLLILPFFSGGYVFAAEEDADNAGMSGFPIPRFVSLHFEEVNTRSGPGTRYPIRWVYKRKHLPVEVVEEFEQWRKIKDQDGEEGWVHKSQLSGARTAMLKQEAILHRLPDVGATAIVRAQAGVVADVLECRVDWCLIEADHYKGWADKKSLFGVYPKEIFEN